MIVAVERQDFSTSLSLKQFFLCFLFLHAITQVRFPRLVVHGVWRRINMLTPGNNVFLKLLPLLSYIHKALYNNAKKKKNPPPPWHSNRKMIKNHQKCCSKQSLPCRDSLAPDLKDRWYFFSPPLAASSWFPGATDHAHGGVPSLPLVLRHRPRLTHQQSTREVRRGLQQQSSFPLPQPPTSGAHFYPGALGARGAAGAPCSL